MNNLIYCQECGNLAQIVRITTEIFPGQYDTSFKSACCNAPLEDISGNFYLYGELSHAYEEQQSWEISE